MTFAIRFQNTIHINTIEDIEESIQVKLIITFFTGILMKGFLILRVIRNIDISAVAGQKKIALKCFRFIDTHKQFRKNAKQKFQSFRGYFCTLLTKSGFCRSFFAAIIILYKFALKSPPVHLQTNIDKLLKRYFTLPCEILLRIVQKKMFH